MARSLNKCTIIGNVGRDPEMRYTPQGTPVTSFSVAVSRNRGSRDGTQQEETDWFRVSAWNKLAEICNDYLTKGALVYVEGPVQVHTWNRNDGGFGASLEMTARDVRFLSAKSSSGIPDADSGTDWPAGDVANNTNDDIPF